MKIVETKSFKLAANQSGDPKANKLALVLPARLDTKDYANNVSHVEFLANRGYLAACFDPPGTWQSGDDLSLYTMTNYLTAINELIDYYGGRETLLVGHSRGGSMAMLAGTRNKKVTAWASIMSWYAFDPTNSGMFPAEQWKRDGYLVSNRDLPDNPQELTEFRLPYGFYEDQLQYDMSRGLKESKKPKLFVFGESDTTVEPEIVKRAYKMAAVPKMLRSVESDHDYRKKPELIGEINVILGEFLEQMVE